MVDLHKNRRNSRHLPSCRECRQNVHSSLPYTESLVRDQQFALCDLLLRSVYIKITEYCDHCRTTSRVPIDSWNTKSIIIIMRLLSSYYSCLCHPITTNIKNKPNRASLVTKQCLFDSHNATCSHKISACYSCSLISAFVVLTLSLTLPS